PGLGAFYVERAGLRVQVRELADLRHQVVLGADLAGETVLGEQFQDHRWLDPGHRGRAAERPGVLARIRPELDDLGITHSGTPPADPGAPAGPRRPAADGAGRGRSGRSRRRA